MSMSDAPFNIKSTTQEIPKENTFETIQNEAFKLGFKPASVFKPELEERGGLADEAMHFISQAFFQK